jgi:Ni/Fe-hydrogenase 1 B-type cytochrome subunit
MTTLHPSSAQPSRADNEAAEFARAKALRSVYVYEAPVRIWHWITVLAITVMAVTGYFIGQPLPTMPGEASDHFLMGYIRFAHFAAAYVFAIGLLGRLYWAFVGNVFSRELFSVPIFTGSYWREMGQYMAWYSFLRRRPTQHAGHNPVARFAMHFLFLWISIFMVFTGFALYGEGSQAGSWQERLFGWVIPLLGQSQDVHTYHRLAAWGMVTFIIVHIYAAVREDIMGRQTIISTMVSGYRTFKD